MTEPSMPKQKPGSRKGIGGRPALDVKRTRVVRLRLTPDEGAALEALARARKTTLSNLIRDALNLEAGNGIRA